MPSNFYDVKPAILNPQPANTDLSNLSSTGESHFQAPISDLSTIRSGASAGATAVQPGSLATVATSGSYNDLSNKPTIPTVNNATLTIQKNGTSVSTFTSNASSDVTCNITVPTQASDIDAQSILVSGTNIKTINGNSVLGSGNLAIIQQVNEAPAQPETGVLYVIPES